MAQSRTIIHYGVLSLRVGLGLLFIWAGTIKVWDPATFLIDIQGYRLLPYRLEVVTALYLPWLEIVCGLSMVIGRLGRRGATLILGILMSVFTVALLAGWYRGLDITCGCFGSGDGQTRYGAWIVRDLTLLGAIALVWLEDRCRGSTNCSPV